MWLLPHSLTAGNGSNMTDDNPSDDYTDHSSIIMTVVSAVSIFCDALVLLTITFPHLRDRVYIKIIIYITIANLLSALGTVLGYASSGSASCYWQGFITNAMPISSVFWTIYVTFMLYCIVESGKLVDISWMAHGICWGLPILLSSLPFINSTYGAVGSSGWCFVVPYSSDPAWIQFWYWFSFYAWIWLGIVVNFLLYGRLAFSITKIRAEGSKSMAMMVFNKLLVYPFIVIFCWIVVCVRDTTIAFNIVYRYTIPVTMLGNALATVQGILTSFYYFYTNEEVINAWIALLFLKKSIEEIVRESKQRRSSYSARSNESSRKGASSSVVVPHKSEEVDNTEEDAKIPVLISRSKPNNVDTLTDATSTNKGDDKGEVNNDTLESVPNPASSLGDIETGGTGEAQPIQ